MNKNETCIGKIVHSKLPIEWMRYNMYIEDDRYRNIAMLVFRVQESCPGNLVDNLKDCINNLMEKCLGKYCDCAIYDIPMLAKHIAETFYNLLY